MKEKMKTTNPQDILVDELEGIYLVDAGAGTGKTHTIVRRYKNLLDKGINPKDILLITFTRNAAAQLKEEVMKKVNGKTSITDFLDAPIINFHSLCARLLKNYGTDSPKYLGLNEILAGSFNIIENHAYETEIFRKFFLKFKEETINEYENIYLSINDNHSVVLNIIKKLSSRGIFPTDSGWISEDKINLTGDRDIYSEKFDKLNEPVYGNSKGENQNVLLNLFKKNKDYFYLDFDFTNLIRGKRIDPSVKDEIFTDETQEELIKFIRHIYLSYIEYMLKKNMLNFEFVVMLAFLILYNDDKIRKDIQYLYAMVDEFQDTDEIQFQLLMLLLKDNDGKANLAVVGDWKQGIYGFRNTTIENITEFGKRLTEYKEILNSGKERISFDTENVKQISFIYNYRSSQDILNFSKHTLLCEAKNGEEANFELTEEKFGNILTAKRELEDLTEIEFYKSAEDNVDSEIELILKKISELVNNEKYVCREFDSAGEVINERRIRYSDICVLSRLNNFALKLQRAGFKKNIPITFGGGLELFSTKEGILVLAWLRLIINEDNVEGWIPVLEKEGYNYQEILQITNDIQNEKNKLFNMPSDLRKFRDFITSKKDNILFVVESILERYGFDDAYGNSILNETGNWITTDLNSISELVRIIDFAKTQSFNIEVNKTVNSVITQSIHMAKGLEYPVVILANMNRAVFPSARMTYNDIFFNTGSGLRFRKQFRTSGEYSAVFNNWKSDILVKMFKPENYDEERRLFYVAVTRAKQYLYFTACKPSKFFETISEISGKDVISDFDYSITRPDEEEILTNAQIKIPDKIEPGKKFYSVHTLMEEKREDISSNEAESHYRSKSDAIDFGVKIHQIASRLANGIKIKSKVEEINRISEFISTLKGAELRSEVDFLFPKENKIIRGTIDLLAIYDDRIEVIDYKTDKSKKYLDKYMIQLKIYKDVVKEIYKDKKVTGKIFFVRLDEVLSV